MIIDNKRKLQESDIFGEYSIVELEYLKKSEEELVK